MTDIINLHHHAWDAEMPSETGTLRAVRLAQHAGTPTLRRGPEDERTLAQGEVVSLPAGRAGAHQILNRATEPARVLIVATNDLPEVAEQVENQQLDVITGDGLRPLPLTAPITAGTLSAAR